MAIIPPKELNVGAVVPHSLDNQFISDALLRQMIKAGQDFNTPSIKERRSRLSRAEFMRSLLYAKEVVVNRAYFVNTPYLFELYRSESGARDFAELMRTGAIIPFITGKDLLEEKDFDQHPDGARALKRLAPLIRHIQNVSLDTANTGAARRSDPLEILGLHATDLFASLDGIDANSCSLLLRELGTPAHFLFGAKRTLVDEFQRLLQELAEMAKLARDKWSNRNHEFPHRSPACCVGQLRGASTAASRALRSPAPASYVYRPRRARSVCVSTWSGSRCGG